MRPLGEIWLYYADSSCRQYSPLYDRLCRVAAASDDVLDLQEAAPPIGHHPGLLLAAVHFLLLGGADHPLAAVYAGGSATDPGPLFVDFCLAHRDELVALLATRHVNTNEVGRSALLGPAFTALAGRVGAPVAHVDVGCSAGLNLLADRYRLDYGPLGATGPADAPVRIDCEVVGGRPPIAPALPEVVARVGLDLDPIDVRDPDELRWQLACVWPDTGRLPRTRQALAEAAGAGLDLRRGDAVDDIGPVLAGLPAGVPAVVTTTWVLAYFSPPQRLAFRDALAAASRDRVIAWVSGESQGIVDVLPSDAAPVDPDGVELSVLGLVTFLDGEARPELLGYAHSHGSRLDWRVSG